MQRLKAIIILSLTSLQLVLAEHYECFPGQQSFGICAANEPSRHQHRRFSSGGKRRRGEEGEKHEAQEAQGPEKMITVNQRVRLEILLQADPADPRNPLRYLCEEESDVHWCCPPNRFFFDDPDLSLTVDTDVLDDYCVKGKRV
ncbi:hypothetical protein KEM48_001783 [Puccinia striiformis f. sp. tritici PST-130]|nr:hypothetical protein KEM48_001783 [Puccinia striiformis f. sp. tritici PST-130]